MLHGTQLTGPIPPELGSLTNLERLGLANNHLTGQLPESFLTLGLTSFDWYGNAGLCAPDTVVFRAWLSGIQYHRAGPFCSAGG
ncbi:MAG: hypothetical protein OXN92_03630 [Gammaproteobacteria bacterium]|nr:hypothetical protein [Gammaproteobacteria bacterium]